MSEASVSKILKVLGEGITIQGSCLTYFFICLIIIVCLSVHGGGFFYTRVCTSVFILESNLKHNLGYQEISVTSFYLLFHLGIYLQIEWLC